MNSFPLSLFNTLRQAATHLAVLPEEVSVEIYLLSAPPFLMQSPKACPRSFCTRSKILAGQAKVDSPSCKMVSFSTKKGKTVVLTQNSSAASQESEYCQNERDIKRVKNPQDNLGPVSLWCTWRYTILGGHQLFLWRLLKMLYKIILNHPLGVLSLKMGRENKPVSIVLCLKGKKKDYYAADDIR